MRFFVVNTKSYIFGSELLKLARIMDEIAPSYNSKMIVAVPHTDIKEVSEAIENIEVFAQHVDPVERGAYTGWVPVEAIKEAGARGSIINHSEHRMKLSDIHFVVDRLRENRLKSLVCADNPHTASAVAVLKPDMVAMEPPELIGTGRSVSRTKPRVVVETIEEVRNVGFKGPILVGAGISDAEDVRKSIELGADGVLLASAVVKAKDPRRIIIEMMEALG
jgi:triosephosphate isomerase